MGKKVCSIDGCGKNHVGHSYCKSHYRAFTKYGDPLISKKKVAQRGTALCSVQGCNDDYFCLGLCSKHYQRQHRHGSLEDTRKKSAQSIDEIKWRKTAKGYLTGYLKSKSVLQHRIVWEQHHGRVLHPYENIHHINGIKDDNRIENLEVWVTAQPAGQRPEDLAAWVVENYRDLVEKELAKKKPRLKKAG